MFAGDDGVELSLELRLPCSSVSIRCLRSAYIFNANDTLSQGWDTYRQTRKSPSLIHGQKGAAGPSKQSRLEHAAHEISASLHSPDVSTASNYKIWFCISPFSSKTTSPKLFFVAWGESLLSFARWYTETSLPKRRLTLTTFAACSWLRLYFFIPTSHSLIICSRVTHAASKQKP